MTCSPQFWNSSEDSVLTVHIAHNLLRPKRLWFVLILNLLGGFTLKSDASLVWKRNNNSIMMQMLPLNFVPEAAKNHRNVLTKLWPLQKHELLIHCVRVYIIGTYVYKEPRVKNMNTFVFFFCPETWNKVPFGGHINSCSVISPSELQINVWQFGYDRTNNNKKRPTI